MGGIPALDLWDVFIEVLHSSSNRIQGELNRAKQLRKHTSGQTKIQLQRDDLDFVNVDYVSPNAKYFRSGAMCFFEDNEAVIQIINKGLRPTLRHVSRTHRVALDWFVDRINLDPKIQIIYIDTKHQPEDILTKRQFHM